MVDIDLSVTINGVFYPNPLIVASGPSTLNSNAIMKCFESSAGGVVTKTITYDPTQQSQPKPRMYVIGKREVFAGRFYSLYSVDLMSEYKPERWVRFIRDVKREMRRRGISGGLIASIAGRSYDEWGKLAAMMGDAGADAIELNLSCPHIEGDELMGRAAVRSPEAIRSIIEAVKENSSLPVIGKLTPHGANLLELARLMVSAGADSLVSTARFQGLVVDVETLRAVSWGGFGGYGGPWQLPISLSWTAKIAGENLGVPVIGSGGVSLGEDIARFILVGAEAAQCCTAIMLMGREIIPKMIMGLKDWMDRHGFTKISDFKGLVLKSIIGLEDLNRRRVYRLSVTEKCTGCGLCIKACPYDAIRLNPSGRAEVNLRRCDNCGLCASLCPAEAIICAPRKMPHARGASLQPRGAKIRC
ncbi:MAG: 4Fe-4S binding protein [Candidatus Bathyarchaeia archaeon]